MSVDSTQATSSEGVQERTGRYRDRWRWDRIGWASHCIDCYPGNCPMRVYVKDGIALREPCARNSAAPCPRLRPEFRT